MKALVYQKKNKETPLMHKEVATPKPKSSEILVKIKSCALNAADYRTLQLGMVPKSKILGTDFSGEIVDIGKEVSNYKIGDQIMGDLIESGFGGLAEYAIAYPQHITKKPSSLTDEIASALPLAGCTALHGIRDFGQLQTGQSILIVGSSGGVGSFALQLAKYYGGRITAICSTSNVSTAYKLGAQKVFDYKVDHIKTLNTQFDVILGINGHYSWRWYQKHLNPNGRCIMIGGSLRQLFTIMFFGPLLSIGSKKYKVLRSKSSSKDLEFLAELCVQGKIAPVISDIFTFDQADKAFEKLSTGRCQGKVVIQF